MPAQTLVPKCRLSALAQLHSVATPNEFSGQALSGLGYLKTRAQRAARRQPADQKRFGLGKTTAREMAQLVESIEHCDLGAPELCKRMIEIMKRQFYRNSIPRFIETADTSEEDAAIANKTGALDDVRNDVGIVYAKSAPIVISAFTWDNADHRWTPENEPELLIARMAKAIVDAWSPRGLSGEAQKNNAPKK